MNKLACDSFSSSSSEGYRKVNAEKVKSFPGLGIFQVSGSKFAIQRMIFMRLIIHSKTKADVTMKNSSLANTLSGNNRSKRKVTGVTKSTVVSDKLCSQSDEQTHGKQITSAVNQRLLLKSSPHSTSRRMTCLMCTEFSFSLRFWIILSLGRSLIFYLNTLNYMIQLKTCIVSLWFNCILQFDVLSNTNAWPLFIFQGV